MMGKLLSVFCGNSVCSADGVEQCALQFTQVFQPSYCVNHMVIVCCDVLLLLALILVNVYCCCLKKSNLRVSHRPVSALRNLSAVYNGCLGVLYIGTVIWMMVEKVRNGDVSPVHWWVLFVLQGFTWLLMGLTVWLKGGYLQIMAIFVFLYTVFFCFVALFAAIVHHEVTVKVGLDVLSFIGACLLVLCTCWKYTGEETGETNCRATLYTPLIGGADGAGVSPSAFGKAGFLSKISFWWLNQLMRLGRDKILNEVDMPELRESERAESCYLQFLEEYNKRKADQCFSESLIVRTIIECNWREILVSGLFALVKTLTVSAGPLLLNGFIEVAAGKEAFRYEGYVLAVTLFFAKILESLSQRQWFFRSRLVGLKVRSLLTAAIYKKQLKLSNAARRMHSGGEIMNYVTVDAYRIGEFPFWFHQIWTTGLQLCLVLLILINSVGFATIASLVVIILTVLANAPLANLQHKFQTKLMVAQDERLKASSESLSKMKVLKSYAWETHFMNVIDVLRKVELGWLSRVQSLKAYNGFLFWLSPVLVSAATFGACYALTIPLHASNVFTFVATLSLVQDPIRAVPDIIGVLIQARVALARIVRFLDAPEIHTESVKKKSCKSIIDLAVVFKSANLSWDSNSSKPTLRNINLDVKQGQKVAICGEVGSGKSTLLAAILGEVPYTEGTVEVYGKIAYVSQTAWIQMGTIRDNILFGSAIDELRYMETLHRCSLVKDLDLLPYSDMTEIGERGANLSGGQKQRIQLARALYQDADIYVLDDPFSAVDAHTATSLFNEYVMNALSGKTVLLVTNQVDFLPAFDCCLMMSEGEIFQAGPYNKLLASSHEFVDLVNAHKETAGTETMAEVRASGRYNHSAEGITMMNFQKQDKVSKGEQLIREEEREVGDTGMKPYLLYLKQNKGLWYLLIVAVSNILFVGAQISQNAWLASNVDNPHVTQSKLILIYFLIGLCSALFLLIRTLAVVSLGMEASKSLFSQMLESLFHAPLSFYDSTPLGRILSRVSVDLSIIDLDVPGAILATLTGFIFMYSLLGVLAIITWQVLFVSIPVIYVAIRLQRFYFATAKELMRINGTTKSLVANHLAESIAGVMTIRAFEVEDRFFAENLNLIDKNASPFFHNFTANEWLTQRLEFLTAIILLSAALCMVLLPSGTFKPGFIGMALSYGLSLNLAMVFCIRSQCILANYIISAERLGQYMCIPSEGPAVIKDNRPPQNWPSVGKVKICNLQIKYRADAPLVLQGISCTFEGGDKIGIVGRTGSGKTTLIGALFRLVEPVGGKIVVDDIDISTIGLHDVRSRFGMIPQDPTLFNASVRFNLDPLGQHDDETIWEVLGKCQLKEQVQQKQHGLNSLVVEDGSNWSMGQRQLFCLGRAMLRRSRILVLDEATASIDNATDMILQRCIRTEFADCTVITVAHRIPTVMDCTKVLAISDGKLVEFDEPMKLMKNQVSLFRKLVNQYWSHIHHSSESHS